MKFLVLVFTNLIIQNIPCHRNSSLQSKPHCQSGYPKQILSSNFVNTPCYQNLESQDRSRQVRIGQVRTGQFFPVWAFMFLFVPICTCMVLHVPVWSHMVLYSQLLVFWRLSFRCNMQPQFCGGNCQFFGGNPLSTICSHSFVEVIVSFLEVIL